MKYFTPYLDGFNPEISDLNTQKAYLFKEVVNLSEKHPEIVKKIEEDINEYALSQKQIRIADSKYENKNQPYLIDLSEVGETNPVLTLSSGRPRSINPEFLLYLLILRGCYGSISNQELAELTKDSVTIQYIMSHYKCKKLAVNTMRENLNKISHATLSYIFQCQIQVILESGLDDFTEVLIDSTAVAANSAYPTDITVLNKLLDRIDREFATLELFGIERVQNGKISVLLKEISSLVASISMSSGTNNRKTKRQIKKKSKKLFKKSKQLINVFLEEQLQLQPSWESISLCPSKAVALDTLWGRIEQDLEDVEYVLYYAELLFKEKVTLPSVDKILSISDPDAAYIQKGGRIPVIGYKPQIVRSGNGFICGHITPRGNASDSSMFMPTLNHVIANTLVIPSIVSVDDGYTSRDNLDAALALGIQTISFSGSKGKNITEDYWDTTANTYARCKRSAVESGMFTLKFNHNFGRMARRGIDAVNSEQLEKVIAYNFIHILRTRKRLSEEALAA